MKIYYLTSEENNRSIYLAVRICALLSRARLRGSSSGDDGERNASPDSLAQEAGDLEVSSRRVSPDPARPEDNPMATRTPQYPALEESHQKSLAPSGMRSDILKGLLERATISE